MPKFNAGMRTKKERNVIESNRAGNFFYFVNSQVSRKRGLGTSHSDNSYFIAGQNDCANLLNDYFYVNVYEWERLPALDRAV